MADSIPERVAVKTIDDEFTFAQIDERSTRLANPLISIGVKPGDHVAVHSMNRIEWVDAFYGVMKARALPIHFNFKNLHVDLAYLYVHAQLLPAIVASVYMAAVPSPALRSAEPPVVQPWYTK